jgi:hypothetical protein
VVFESEANYMLLTFERKQGTLAVELKRLDGHVIDRQVYGARAKR